MVGKIHWKMLTTKVIVNMRGKSNKDKWGIRVKMVI